MLGVSIRHYFIVHLHQELAALGGNLVKSCKMLFQAPQHRYGDSSCCAGSARVDATRRVAGDVRFTVQRLKTSLHFYSRFNENNGRLQSQIRVADLIGVNITAFRREIPFITCSHFLDKMSLFFCN